MKRLSDDLKSSLTAAKLKALCILNDLPTSGNKSDLVSRLLESGLSRDELGIEAEEAVEEVIEAVIEDEPIQPSLSLEDEDTLTPEIEPEVVKPVVESTDNQIVDASLDEVLDAEVLDAEFVTLDEEVKAPKTVEAQSTTSKSSGDAATLLDMIKQPKIAAVFVVVLILGAGTWYYFNNQLEPFTADTLRYGDEMTYTISDGDFMASEGFLDLVLDQIETEDDICKLRLLFDGSGDVSISNGGSSELVSQASLDRLGAVSAKGGQGMDWLTVESVSEYDFSAFTIQRHLRSSIPGSSACSDFPASVSGTADLTSTQWTELRDRASIGTAVDWNLNVEDTYQGNLMTFGVGGILGDLDTLSPGFSMLLQPVELQELLANDYIDDGATGSRLGWDWRVLGTETLGSTEMWKIVATNQDVQELCLGSASMTLLVEEGNPWATKQTVNVVISGSDSNRQGCSTTTKLLGDYVLPDGELTMSHTFQKSSLSRGSKGLEFGLSYDARPQANELSPNDDELNDWGPNGEHMPDESTLRTHNLEAAIDCLDYLQTSASGAVAALDDGGYVWRAIDQQYATSTQWNISWIATDDIAGWVTFNMTGTPSQENCQFDKKGSYDETVSYNREFIPKVLNISTIEESLLDSTRFPMLTSDQGLFTNAGNYHPETRVGYLVVVPGSGINTILTNIGDATDGASTVDISRDWTEDGWNKRFNLIADATDGRIIGWNYVMNT
ncbi:MAG: SAP domain-containing protein [Candidatus Poseidoniaceae archaeon]